MVKLTRHSILRRERERHLGLAASISLGSWIIMILALSVWFNCNPQSWEATTASWGYASFRDWGDSFVAYSLLVAMAMIGILYTAFRAHANRHR